MAEAPLDLWQSERGSDLDEGWHKEDDFSSHLKHYADVRCVVSDVVRLDVVIGGPHEDLL